MDSQFIKRQRPSSVLPKALPAALFLVVCMVSLPLAPGLAQTKPLMDLRDSMSVDEVNRSLAQRAGRTKGRATFHFGFDLRSGPLEDARQYLPFLNYLSRATGYDFKLRFTSKSSSIIDDLGTGKVHFAAVGAVSFIKAHEKSGAVHMVRGKNKQGGSEYRSAFVVLPDSRFENLQHIKGASVAFGSRTSTQGHLIPRITLARHGIELNDLTSYEFAGSHRSCVNSVLKRAFDVCGMQDTMALELASRGLVRVLHMSGYYPSSGIASNKDVSLEVIETVKRALLDFDPLDRDKKGLYDWQRTEMPNGFGRSDSTDYAELRSWLIRLGLLESKTVSPRREKQE